MAFWEEIFGCVTYLELPYETVMSMPIYLRKYWIEKHNRSHQEHKARSEGLSTVEGTSLNSYARLEQTKMKNGGQ